VVPQYYEPNWRIGYKTSLGHPAVLPVSYQGEDWIVDYWYRKPQGGNEPASVSIAAPASAAH
ncbi:MAG TPA: ABC transporter substrate-binding protein, partial [Trinickia sp.]|nr:ABC transporter substrate-binding protein [Trinickia sp.]